MIWCCLGILIGFLTQVVSLGAYVIILVLHNNWGRNNVVQKTEGGGFLYAILSILAQIDIGVYLMISTAFACTMMLNRGGAGIMAMLRDRQFQTPVSSSSSRTSRFVFVSDVLCYFLVGFVAMSASFMIYVYLGFPIPYLLSVATFIADLVVCHMMIWG